MTGSSFFSIKSFIASSDEGGRSPNNAVELKCIEKVIDKIKNFFIRYIKGNSNKIIGNLKNYIKICQISKKIMDKKRKFSSPLVDGPEQAASRSMLRAAGFEDDDFNRPQVGVASTWSMVTPCNMHINDLAGLVCDSIDANNLKSVLFNTITISDGISMGLSLIHI